LASSRFRVRRALSRIYGVIFGLFYLGSGIGIWGLPKIRELSADHNYHNGLYVAAAVLIASALVMIFLPKYRFNVGAEAPQPAPGAAPAPQHV
jgi:hypothetical protein